MAKGIYCYRDIKNNNIVYIGKDSYIDKKQRYKEHLRKSNYSVQKINQILQNTPSRYSYEVLWQVHECPDDILNFMERYFILQYDPKFNFTKGGDGVLGFKHSNIGKKKISQALKGRFTGENHPMFGKTHSDEIKKRISKTMCKKYNTTGFYRVSTINCSTCKQSFIWIYRFITDNTQQSISSVDLKKLEKKVKDAGLEWFIIDQEKAKKSLEINDMFN